MTLVIAKMPSCTIFNGIRQEYIDLWKSQEGKPVQIHEAKRIEGINKHYIPCDTDFGFKIVDKAFLEKYHQIGNNLENVWICRHMFEAGD